MIGPGKGVTHNSVNQATAPGSTGFANESHLLPQLIKKDTSLTDRSFEILILLCITKKIICIRKLATPGSSLPLCSPSSLFHLGLSVSFSPSLLSCCYRPISSLTRVLSQAAAIRSPLKCSLSNLPESFKNPYLCLPLSSPISAPSLRSRLLPSSRCDSPFLPTLWQAMWLCFLPALSSSAPYLSLPAP